jgi:mRNA interferase MazF
VVPVSSSRAASPLRPMVSTADGIDRESAAICRGVRAVSRRRFVRRIGRATPATLSAVETALAVILGLEAA